MISLGFQTRKEVKNITLKLLFKSKINYFLKTDFHLPWLTYILSNHCPHVYRISAEIFPIPNIHTSSKNAEMTTGQSQKKFKMKKYFQAQK